MRLTKKQRSDYINSPHHCPKCNSADISAGDFEPEGMYQTIECEGCGGTWQEVFALVDIENFKEE